MLFCHSSGNSPNSIMNCVCIVTWKSPKSSISEPKRQVAMPAKQPMSSMMRMAAWNMSSPALTSVPVSSASLGCTAVHWMTRRSETMRMMLQNVLSEASVEISPVRLLTSLKKSVFLLSIDTSSESQGMRLSPPTSSLVWSALSIFEGMRNATNTITMRAVAVSVSCLKESRRTLLVKPRKSDVSSLSAACLRLCPISHSRFLVLIVMSVIMMTMETSTSDWTQR
mmetsp:Transcript_59393/g.121667  ORF Transcript_59393/g.121667 Transcript_59393/m.121667 type:complete len:225 (-) Transcript_59393:3-677(-)